MNAKKGGEKLIDECLRILREESAESTQKWITDKKITSLALRNVKALEIISLSNYIMQKMLIAQSEKQYQLLNILIESNKKNSAKCHQYARLLKHFSQWDYEFQYIYKLALNEQLQQLEIYLRVRDIVLHSKKEILSGVTAQLDDWANLAKIVFKQKEQEDIIDQFTTIVKQHYVEIKKSQSDKINGAQFLKICQIIDSVGGNVFQLQKTKSDEKKRTKHSQSQKQMNSASKIYQETILNGISTQDRQLIRVLSYQDKNIAKMLEQKHAKMVQLISEEVNNLRKDINHEKQRYVELVEQKKLLIRLVERLKDSALKYIVNRNESNQFQLLQLLDNYNKKYNPRALDVTKTTDVIQNRRLIEIIQKEELEKDQI